MRAAAYIRVSSRGQDAMRRAAIEKAARERGDTIGVWYAEKRTATSADRPELQCLVRDVEGGRHRRVYVFRLDRLTRMGIADTLALVKHWRAHGVEIVNLSDGFSIPAPSVEGSAAAHSGAHPRHPRVGHRDGTPDAARADLGPARAGGSER